jgi:deazaflavin-dependent oxidoreductase (nitroreductase family)
MTDMNDFNQGVIAEFRANGGKVGGPFEGASMVLVTHTGAKSGVQRTTPLVCSRDGDDVVIIASMGGAPTNPAWYHNMVTNTAVHVEIGDESYDATVVEAQGDERDRLFAAQAAVMPQFAEYEVKAGARVIPVLRLVRN